MKPELYNYDIFPKVFPINKTVELTVSPRGVRPFENREYTVAVYPLSEGSPNTYPTRGGRFEQKLTPNSAGRFVLTVELPYEGEYFVRIFDGSRRLLQLSVFAVSEDLAGRIPRIGDLHLHTYRSDGHEAPAMVAANYRAFGYDFLAITDHHRYYPSLEAAAAYKDVDHALTMVPGEEVHLPSNDVHIVNFGGMWSVNELIAEKSNEAEVPPEIYRRAVDGAVCPDRVTTEEYRRQVEELAETLDIPENVERFTYAACVWAFNQIRAAGGLGIFAHPYWISDMFQVPESLTDYMLLSKPFDAFEVLGGERYFEQNGYQASKYYDDRANGRDYPIVGSTDSHSSNPTNAGAYVARTMVFTPENERKSIIRSIKEKYSVAIDGILSEARPVGEFRLVKYAWFLLENYFPLHDKLTAEDGRLMSEYYLADEPDKQYYAGKIADCKAEMARFEKKYFAF